MHGRCQTYLEQYINVQTYRIFEITKLKNQINKGVTMRIRSGDPKIYETRLEKKVQRSYPLRYLSDARLWNLNSNIL